MRANDRRSGARMAAKVFAQIGSAGRGDDGYCHLFVIFAVYKVSFYNITKYFHDHFL